MPLDWKWIRGDFDDVVENRSFAAVKVVVNNQVLTRSYDHIAEAERETVNVTLYPLALALAENWWKLLYEPRKSDEANSAAEICHSLDSWMNGFVFPPVTVWSGGSDTIVIEQPSIRQEHSNLEFFPASLPSSNLPRIEVEQNLFNLVQAVIERIPSGNARALNDAWNRVLETLGNADELQYCQAAGRVGIDPYDADSADISAFADGLSEHLFEDICEAATSQELPLAVDWARQCERDIGKFPGIETVQFGIMPARDPNKRIWVHGYDAAKSVRRNLHLEGFGPRRVVDEMFGAAVRADVPTMPGGHPMALEAIANYRDGTMRVALPAISARQRRFRLCRASYLSWKTLENASSAVTTATTLDQQASRAFAAELLAPEQLLRDYAGEDGLTPEKIDSLAEECICPEAAIIWQAYNHGIRLRGVALPKTSIA